MSWGVLPMQGCNLPDEASGQPGSSSEPSLRATTRSFEITQSMPQHSESHLGNMVSLHGHSLHETDVEVASPSIRHPLGSLRERRVSKAARGGHFQSQQQLRGLSRRVSRRPYTRRSRHFQQDIEH